MVAEATVAEATVRVVKRKHRPAGAMWRRSYRAASTSTAALAERRGEGTAVREGLKLAPVTEQCNLSGNYYLTLSLSAIWTIIALRACQTTVLHAR